MSFAMWGRVGVSHETWNVVVGEFFEFAAKFILAHSIRKYADVWPKLAGNLAKISKNGPSDPNIHIFSISCLSITAIKSNLIFKPVL